MSVRRILLAGIVGAVLVGCGVPTDSTPRKVDPQDVPFGLLERDAPQSDAPQSDAR